MKKEIEKENEGKRCYAIVAIKYQLEYGEEGVDVVRMVTSYVSEGWMDWGQASMMLKSIFEPEPDDGKENYEQGD